MIDMSRPTRAVAWTPDGRSVSALGVCGPAPLTASVRSEVMMTEYTFEWRNGRKEQVEFLDHGYFYVLPDRTLVSFQPKPGWCHDCGKFTLCEWLRKEAVIREELAEMLNPRSARWQRRRFSPLPLEKLISIEKDILEGELRHILVRSLPPSCLSCGRRQVSFLQFGEWGLHPGTGEEFRLCMEGWYTGISRSRPRYYDTDGHALELTKDEEVALRDSSHRRP